MIMDMSRSGTESSTSGDAPHGLGDRMGRCVAARQQDHHRVPLGGRRQAWGGDVRQRPMDPFRAAVLPGLRRLRPGARVLRAWERRKGV